MFRIPLGTEHFPDRIGLGSCQVSIFVEFKEIGTVWVFVNSGLVSVSLFLVRLQFVSENMPRTSLILDIV